MFAASSGRYATDMEDFVSEIARQIALAINVVAIVIVTAGVVQAVAEKQHFIRQQNHDRRIRRVVAADVRNLAGDAAEP